ncbi:hypothetical protein ACFL3G_10515 [Planctomycetota bacterium]
MELIKRIKEAETQAQEIIEQAKTHAAQQVEQSHKDRLSKLEQAQQQRRLAIDTAVDNAQKQGFEQAEKLKAKAEKDREQLRKNVGSKMANATAKVMDYLKG